MSEQIEIIKQVKLTAAQRIALVAAANNKGVLANVEYGVRETLRYLGLVEERRLHSDAEIDHEVAEAWKRIGAAVRAKDIRHTEDLIHTIRDHKWKREKKAWHLTTAANEYLLRGRVIVTVGPKKESDVRSRMSA